MSQLFAKIKRDGEGKDSVWTFPSYNETVLATKRHEPWSQAYSVAAINSELRRYYAYSDTIAGRIKSVILGADSSLMRAFRYSPQGDMSWLSDLLVGQDCSSPPSGVEVDGYACSPSSNATRTLGLEYDAARNLRKQVDSVSMATDTAVVAAGNRLTSWGAKSYTFDADGNMITRTIGGTTTTFSYDGESMLRRVIVGSDTTCYEYNALNQLVFIGTGCKNSNNTNDTPRKALRIFVWDRDQIMAEVDSTASIRFAEYVYRPGIDRPHALLTDSAGSTVARFFHQDMLGNVIGVTRGASLAQSLKYEPWGELTGITGTLADTSRLRWKGLYWEGGNTKLYYVRNRWYDPEARRFTSEDPIGIDGGLNLYAFSRNDWVNGADPFGLEECPVGVTCLPVVPITEQADDPYRSAGHNPFASDRGGRPWANQTLGLRPGRPPSPRTPRSGPRVNWRSFVNVPCASASAAVAIDLVSGTLMTAALIEGGAALLAVRAGSIGVRQAVSNYVRWSSKKPLRSAGANWASATQRSMNSANVGAGVYLSDVGDDMARGAGMEALLPFGGIRQSWDDATQVCG